MTDNEVARRDEVLAALTRILRREATESAIVTTRERVPTLCADGKVRYTERTDTRVVEIPPKISDVNRAADLLGRRCGLWDEPPEPSGRTVRIVDDVTAGPGGWPGRKRARFGRRARRAPGARDGAGVTDAAGASGGRAAARLGGRPGVRREGPGGRTGGGVRRTGGGEARREVGSCGCAGAGRRNAAEAFTGGRRRARREAGWRLRGAGRRALRHQAWLKSRTRRDASRRYGGGHPPEQGDGMSGCGFRRSSPRRSYPVHEDLRRGGHAEYWLSGGRGSGKSSFVSLEILLGLMRDERAGAIIYRKVADTLRDSVYAQMLWAIDRLGLAGQWQARLSPMELVHRETGQRILFRGADDPQKSKGVRLRDGYFRFLWFEELSEFDGIDAIRTIKASILRACGEGPDARTTVLCTYNPPVSPWHWVNREASRPALPRCSITAITATCPRSGWAIPSWRRPTRCAPTTPAPGGTCTWARSPAPAVRSLKTSACAPCRRDEWEGLPTYSGVDFGFATDPDAFVRCAFDRKRRVLYVVDEFAALGLLIERLAKEVRARAGNDVITCDSAEPRSIAGLRACGLRVTAARKGPDSVGHGLKWLQTLAAIVIDPARCPLAAGEFSRYEYDRDRNGRVLPRYPDHDNHTIDAVRYAMESVSGMKRAVVPR